jgi:hypothetical protein
VSGPFVFRGVAQVGTDLKSLWLKARRILKPYDGAASQVHVLDVPASELERVIDEFCNRATETVITALNGEALDAPRQLDAVSRSEMLRFPIDLTILRGTFQGDRRVFLYVYTSEAGAPIDVEYVFWADEFFPPAQDDNTHMNAFGLVYSLAEMTREGHPNCECALSASETGDPRNERRAPWVLFW